MMNKSQPRRKNRGAVATQRRRVWKISIPRFNSRIIATLLLTVCAGSTAFFAYAALQSASQRPIQSVAIEGDFVRVTRAEMADLINPLIVDGFLRQPLSTIKQEIERHPWIASVNISRRWPDTLAVSIQEQQAIARWGDKGFLNIYGDFVKIEGNAYLYTLPLIDGNLDQSQVLMQRYQQFAQLLQPYGLQVNALQTDARDEMEVRIAGGLTLHLGQDQVLEKFQRFVLVLERSLKPRLHEIESIDMRYNNGLAVRWNTNSDIEQDVLADSGR